MKLLVLCLFAVFCSSLVSVSGDRRRLGQVKVDLNNVKIPLLESGQMFHTPPQNIENCCSVAALRCFRDSLRNATIDEQLKIKLINGLQKRATERSLDFCGSPNTTGAPCQNCTSHPKQNADVFYSRLESLIEQAMTRLKRK